MQAKFIESPVFSCKMKKYGMGRGATVKWEQLLKFSFVQLVELFLALEVVIRDCFQRSLFMGDTHGGATGVGVAGHVEEELRNVSVHAPIPLLKTGEETAVDWLVNQGAVTPKGAQVKSLFTLTILAMMPSFMGFS